MYPLSVKAQGLL